ncbi:pentapeptide repeat-containing protein [Pseudonocardia sp. C8]|uniref:pentapeptide repeat-containing protein n=1 Tax=Pseudonocardia sp. C8 TaxID=2762759 RepID=UPI0016426B7E|nr:pentapeptide repeat-containing protein [Pseudonocardia sp. C8]MBC3189483.1 pentapeptide repeat-containing protein [Pseudonocardia sp. C8]
MPLGRRQKLADTDNKPSPVDESLRPLSAWYVVLAVVAVVLVAAPLTWWLYTIAGDDPGRKIDAIRTGLTTAAGTGGVFALLLAFHRQRITERIAENTRLASKRDHDQRDRVAEQAEKDALARRITEQHAKAAEQLGSDKAPVRLAGLYTLERIGQDNRSEQQTVVNLICAYLRMPYDKPVAPSADGPETDCEENRRRSEELEVRKTAQQILHLHAVRSGREGGPDSMHWPNLLINLANSCLFDMRFDRWNVQFLKLDGADVEGDAHFELSEFQQFADFSGAHFWGGANFSDTSFKFFANFDRTRVVGSAKFTNTIFGDVVNFRNARFDGGAQFYARFEGDIAATSGLWPPEVTISHNAGAMLVANDEGQSVRGKQSLAQG